MSATGNEELRAIPEELLEFFRPTLGQSLVLKGESGTGKTTFVLTLLEDLLSEHYTQKNFIYVTSKISTQFLPSHFESLGDALLPDSTIDATKFVAAKVDDDSVVVANEEAFIKLLRRWVGRNRSPVIVIDTLEALAEKIGTEPVSLVAELNKFGQTKNAKTVLVSERGDAHIIDNLVDGIVVLSMTELDGHVWRELRIRKLRGTQINRVKRGFTLKTNRFCRLWSVDTDKLKRLRSFDMKPHSSTRFFTGVESLDQILGGFRLGSTCFLEVGPGVNNEIVNALVFATASNFLSQGGGVFMIPPNRISYRTTKSAALRYGFIDQLNTSLRLLTYQFPNPSLSNDKPETIEPYWKPVKTKSSEELESEMNVLMGELRDNECNDILVVVGFGLLKSWLGDDHLDRWAMRIATQATEDSGFSIAIGYSSTANVNRAIADVADVHITLSAKSDATLFRGLHPRTSNYCIYTFEADGGIHIGFQEIA